ncbi:MAG: secreted trypsin-like serine protease [Paraglaciecola sp.]|jgi:secreted trypsin-like serine protease
MIKPISALIPAAALLFSSTGFANSKPFAPSTQANNSLATTKIVGGIEAEQANWPWMTAFVVTFDDVATSLDVGDISYETESFSFGSPVQRGPAGEASAQVVDCGIGDTVCADATNKICLIERGDINFSVKVDNCEAGGGVGVIIYNNIAGIISGTLGEDFSGTIPVVAITQDDGLEILEQIAADIPINASISVASTSELQQDSSCGATFLGDKWVLTAAHCVDSPNSNLFKMNVGEYDLSDGAENAIEIANIYIHPRYDADAIDHDIAIVELVSSVNVPGVNIADPALTDQLAIENATATVAGWGGRLGYAPGEGPTDDFPDILHQVDLQLSTNEECRAEFGDRLGRAPQDVGLTDVMICAGVAQGGKSSCQGDSGGPLIVNTGTGVQQVGIVSWGIGCAQAGLPGVFTRVSEFKDWLSTISQGIAITQRHDFPVALQGETQSTELQVSNNSELNAALTFSINGSADFTVDGSNCTNLAADTSCQITVTFTPGAGGKATAEIIISSDNDTILLSKALVLGNAVAKANELTGIAGEASEFVTWFSGGDEVWRASDLDGVESGPITHLQDSILVAKIEGQGTLTFEWSVSSEENLDLEPDDPDFEPYDALYLYVNDELIDSISGTVDYTQYTTVLSAGTNVINWTYNKDPAASEGRDKGFVRNVTFTPPAVVRPTPVRPRSSGGGSLTWLSLSLFALLLFRRRG